MRLDAGVFEWLQEFGDPEHVSTSYVERQNINMRMQMRRFTRLTNAFSKKLENHAHMVALFHVYHNFGVTVQPPRSRGQRKSEESCFWAWPFESKPGKLDV